MKLETIIKELEEAARRLGLLVRRERGSFRGGRCLRNGEELLVLNKNHPPEAQLAVLADALREEDVDNLYLKPSVRQALEDAWARRAQVDIGAEEGDS